MARQAASVLFIMGRLLNFLLTMNRSRVRPGLTTASEQAPARRANLVARANVGGAGSASKKPHFERVPFKPRPVLTMAVGKGQVIALQMNGLRHAHPLPINNSHDKILV